MQRFEEYTLTRAVVTVNEWAEEVPAWTNAGTIRAAVSTASGSVTEMNELLRIDSTHTALTYDSCQAGDRFGGYRITYIIPGAGRRPHQLFLAREDAPPGADTDTDTDT